MKNKCRIYKSCRSMGMPNCTEKCNSYLKSINKDKSDICEWEEGKFNPCSGFNGVVLQTPPVSGEGLYRYFCEICGIDIMKPIGVPKVNFKKSGDTWVKFENNLNYLWESSSLNPFTASTNCWTPFSEIEKEGLTDEIAKLNPKIILCDGDILLSEIAYEAVCVKSVQVFYLIEPKSDIEYYGSDWVHVRKCRLATVSDLETK